jgi:betaine-aldehyde dehydrogenase
MNTLGETKNKTDWEELKKTLLQSDFRMLIGGQLVSAQGDETYETHSPSTGEFLGTVPFAQMADVNAAVESAKKAFGSWKKTPPLERANLLKELVKKFKKGAEQYAVLDAVDGGNPVSAMVSDVYSAAAMMEYVIPAPPPPVPPATPLKVSES